MVANKGIQVVDEEISERQRENRERQSEYQATFRKKSKKSISSNPTLNFYKLDIVVAILTDTHKQIQFHQHNNVIIMIMNIYT